ncbi:MAG TPA: hypothetical protein VLF95_06860, partial [Vicinamibacteria bacterium]|nr:hypothetical protein [Vicinamibacteria bacterium]
RRTTTLSPGVAGWPHIGQVPMTVRSTSARTARAPLTARRWSGGGVLLVEAEHRVDRIGTLHQLGEPVDLLRRDLDAEAPGLGVLEIGRELDGEDSDR